LADRAVLIDRRRHNALCQPYYFRDRSWAEGRILVAQGIGELFYLLVAEALQK